MSYPWAEAEREKLRLAKDEGSSIELAVVERRAFGFFRLIRNRLDGWVARAAPLIAAKAKADEGTVWRAMSEQMRGLQSELASLDLKRALSEMETEEAETDASVRLDPTRRDLNMALVMAGEDDDGDAQAQINDPDGEVAATGGTGT